MVKRKRKFIRGLERLHFNPKLHFNPNCYAGCFNWGSFDPQSWNTIPLIRSFHVFFAITYVALFVPTWQIIESLPIFLFFFSWEKLNLSFLHFRLFQGLLHTSRSNPVFTFRSLKNRLKAELASLAPLSHRLNVTAAGSLFTCCPVSLNRHHRCSFVIKQKVQAFEKVWRTVCIYKLVLVHPSRLLVLVHSLFNRKYLHGNNHYGGLVRKHTVA